MLRRSVLLAAVTLLLICLAVIPGVLLLRLREGRPGIPPRKELLTPTSDTIDYEIGNGGAKNSDPTDDKEYLRNGNATQRVSRITSEDPVNGVSKSRGSSDNENGGGVFSAPADAVFDNLAAEDEDSLARIRAERMKRQQQQLLQQVAPVQQQQPSDAIKAPRDTDATTVNTHVSCQMFGDGFSLCYYENACFKYNSKEVGFLGPSPMAHQRVPTLKSPWSKPGETESENVDVGDRILDFPNWVPERPDPISVRDAVRAYDDYVSLAQLDFTYKDSSALDIPFRQLLVPVQHMREGVARPVPMWEHVVPPNRPPQQQQQKIRDSSQRDTSNRKNMEPDLALDGSTDKKEDGNDETEGGSGIFSHLRKWRQRPLPAADGTDKEQSMKGGGDEGITEADRNNNNNNNDNNNNGEDVDAEEVAALDNIDTVRHDAGRDAEEVENAYRRQRRRLLAVNPASEAVTNERIRQPLETHGAVWVPSLYVVSATYAFKRHLWALGASVSFPLAAALALNASAHLGLPPLEVLLVSTEMRPAVKGEDLQTRFGWNGELLSALLEAHSGQEALTGTRAQEDGIFSLDANGWLTKSAPNPIVLSQRSDIPGQANAPSTRSPPAVCAARAVLLGHKPSFVGGTAEANALRYLLATPLRLKFPYPSAAETSGRRVRLLLLDREASDRKFTNAEELRAVCELYGRTVDTTYLTGAEYARLSFAEQARLFNAHAIVVAAHGAALSNLVFSPPRSVVIEVYPRGVWKPTYARLASNLGHTHLPLFSVEPGGPRHPNAPYVPPVDTKVCSMRSYPRITRDNCYPWLRALPVYVPKDAFEDALLAALNLATYERVERAGKRRRRPKFAPAIYSGKKGAAEREQPEE